MSARSVTTMPSGRIPGKQVLLAGAAAVVGSVIANLIVRAILFAVLDLPADFPPLSPGAIIIVTTLFVSAAVVVFAVVNRLSRKPAFVYSIVALVALVVSILPNLGLMANPSSAPIPGGTSLAFGALIVFHIVAGVVAVGLLLGLTRRA